MDQIRAYDPRQGDWALDYSPRPLSNDPIAQTAWWLTNLGSTRPGISAAVMPIRPKQIGSVDEILRDIRGRMGMLLRGNAPVREGDPEIVRQLTGLGQRTSPAYSQEPFDLDYQEVVPPPVLPSITMSGSYHPNDVDDAFFRMYRRSPAESTIRKYMTPTWLGLFNSTETPFSFPPSIREQLVEDIGQPLMSMKSEMWPTNPNVPIPEKTLWNLFKKGLFP